MKVSTAFSLPVLKTGREEGLLVSQREESQQLQGRQQKDRDAKEKERGFIILQISKHQDTPEDIHFHQVFSRKAGLTNDTAGVKASPANTPAPLLVSSSHG